MPLRYQFLLSAALTLVIKVIVFVFGGVIAWWLAALIALVFVFGGFLIVDSDDFGDGGDDYSDSWWD